ncbi:MAG: hypothetical protein HY770_00105 [Chitinivibrionia bacterium]|nr:hypothetical protein [Chitinivibrionia bacterium]
MLKRLGAFCFFALMLVFQIFPPRVRAGGEGLDVPEPLKRQVPLEGLSGISLFFAKTYNENLVLYAIICTALMAVVGIAIAYVTDAALKMMGMEVGKIEHKE